MTAVAGNYTEEDVLRLAHEAYQHGMATFDLDPQRAALLVIDMQREFIQPHLTKFWIPEATRMVPRLVSVLEAARHAGRPVIHTAFGATHQYQDRPSSGAFMPNRYPALPTDVVEDADRFVPELEPAPGEIVIFKPSYGAFYDTPLDTILRNLECDTVIITGTMTNVCCGTTARQAYERSYKVVFGSDVTATNDPALQQAELQTLRYGFARVLSSAEIIALLAEG